MVYTQVPHPTGEGCRCEADEAKSALPNQTMADIMHETNQLAEDALSITTRLYGFLFPDNICSADRPEEPRCFRDELLRTRANLHTAVAKMAEMASLLGM